MSSSIYEPAEDSYFMSKILSEKIPKVLREDFETKFLEIGSGSGILLETAYKAGIKKENILGCDINPEAIKHCKKLGFNCIHSDLFKKIPKQKFDIIIFNPPYLPKDKNEPKDSQMSTTAGKKGNEIIIKFLKQGKKYLNKKGKIFLITSSLSKEIDFKKLGYHAKKLETKNLFFERLFGWEITK